MIEEGYKFEKLFFCCFQVENKVTSMYKISCLHPFTCFLLYNLFRFKDETNIKQLFQIIELEVNPLEVEDMCKSTISLTTISIPTTNVRTKF
jgi:hypothetical protein